MNRVKFISGEKLPRAFEPIKIDQVWFWKTLVSNASQDGLEKCGFVILSDYSSGGKWMILDVLRDAKGSLYKSRSIDRVIEEDNIYKTSTLQHDINGKRLAIHRRK